MEKTLYKHSFKVPDKPLTSLCVHNTGLQRCEPGNTWGPGIRDHYLIHCVTEGRGTYTALGQTWRLAEGDLFLAWPREVIQYRADAGDPWSYCWVGFGGADASALIKQTDFSRQRPVLHAGDGQTPRDLLLDIYASRGGRPFEAARMTGKLYAFLAWLMESATQQGRKRAQAGLEHVKRACDFIANNYANQITIADVAAGVGVCRSLLTRAFQQHMDVSPVRYLTQYRMDQACLLLRGSDLPIKAVAYSVGFEDPLYFSRRFREVVGMSPREYAESHAQQREG